ncbi:MAG: isochorismatase family protein [Gammaproteobacteria bacterium]|nr:isochorismatase family protein [Gammaproteobacteria bacterium]
MESKSHTDADNIRGGFGGSFRAGQSVALVVVDFQKGFTQPHVSPLAADCSSAVEATARVIEAIRPHGPVFYTVCGYRPGLVEAGRWIEKCGALDTLIVGTEACELDPRLPFDPSAGDLIVPKNMPSAFFGTSLAATLTALGVDTLLITGCTTSGCVRASAVDAIQHGFAPLVIEDACADRSWAQHQSNLIDLQSKYAEVIHSDNLSQWF